MIWWSQDTVPSDQRVQGHGGLEEECDEILPRVCRDNFAFDDCMMHIDACQDGISGPYNMENDCKAGLMPNLCYDVVGDIKAYLDRPDVREVGTDRPCEP
ncbi:unnamed protein product [Tilletia caries]|nr:unnamed protein product [Tilletia caries]CAD6919372.1 unnamed protein product [Tilletia caries]